MSDVTWAAVLSLAGSLVGTLGGILTTARLTDYRLSQLEKRMAELNKLINRVCRLEQKSAVYEERFRTGNGHRAGPVQ